MLGFGSITKQRIIGSTVLLVLGAAAGLAISQLLAGLDILEIREYLPLLGRGLGITLYVTSVTFIAGSLLGLVVAAASVSEYPAMRWMAGCHFNLFRSTPLIAQLYLVYYGAGEISPQLKAIGLWWMFREPMNCVLIVFTLNTSAYQAYVLAGAIRSLPREQREAAQALGLYDFVILWKILIPQALLIAIRPLGNELTKMIKASSIASVVTIFDLLGTTRLIYSETFNFNYFILAGALYVSLVEFTRIGVEGFSSKLERHRKLVPR